MCDVGKFISMRSDSKR